MDEVTRLNQRSGECKSASSPRVGQTPFHGLLLGIGVILLSACTVAQEQSARSAFSNTTQTLADAIRRTETVAWTPAQFDSFVETYVALIPACQPFLKDAETAYAAAFIAGDLSIPALETIATKFDVTATGK